MEILDSGKDKVKKICETLKKQTLDPAKQEAKNIVDHALKEAEKIIRQAKEETRQIFEDQKVKLLQEKKAFHSSLALASNQTLEALKQEIEDHLFNHQISKSFQKETLKESVVAEFIDVIVDSLRKEGLDAKLEAMIPKVLSKQKVVQQLAKEVLHGLNEDTIVLSDFGGGAKVRVKDRHLIIEMTDESLKVLFSRFIRDDFRTLLFETKTVEKS